MEVADAARHGVTALFADDRHCILRRQLAQAAAGWLGQPVHRAAALHGDDDVEDRTASGRGTVDGASVSVEDFVSAIATTPPTRVPGTAVFMTAQPRGTPPALAHNLRYNKILHEHVVVLTVTTAPVPYVAPKIRSACE